MQILLHDGFQNEHVIIHVDGKEVYDKPDVTSKRLTGMADRIDVPGLSGSATVRIDIPNAGLSESVQVDSEHYVAFYLEEGKLRFSVSEHPLGSG